MVLKLKQQHLFGDIYFKQNNFLYKTSAKTSVWFIEKAPLGKGRESCLICMTSSRCFDPYCTGISSASLGVLTVSRLHLLDTMSSRRLSVNIHMVTPRQLVLPLAGNETKKLKGANMSTSESGRGATTSEKSMTGWSRLLQIRRIDISTMRNE